MSKEIAQTVGTKRIAWLIAIVAAFAVFATLGTQWQKSDAALPTTTIALAQAPATPGPVNPGSNVSYTMTTTTTGVNSNGAVVMEIILGAGLQNTTSGVSCPPANSGGAGITWAAGGAGTGTLTCTSSAVLTAGLTNVTMVVLVSAGAGPSAAAPTSARIRDADGININATLAASVGALTINGVTADAPNVGAGQPLTINFTIPAGLTYCSDGSPSGANPRIFAAGDQTSAGVTVQSTVPTAANNNAQGTHTVTVIGAVGGSVTLSTHLAGAAAGIGCSPTAYTIVAADFVRAELRHMSDTNGAPGAGLGVIGQQEINSNVRGSRHTICTVAQNTGIDINGDGDFTDAGDSAPVAVIIPGITLANIVITNGGGYESTADTDPDFTDVRIFEGDGTVLGTTATSGLDNATCISWVSTDAGDQQINIVYVGADGLQYNVSWDSDDNGNSVTPNQVNGSLVKEWNRLEDSVLTIETVAQASQNVVGTYGVVLNPATGFYQLTSADQDIDISDIFRGSHTNSAGGLEGPMSLAGVIWEVGESGCDADVDGALSGVTYLDAAGDVVGYPVIDVEVGDCLPGQSVTINFFGHEPDQLGSGDGLDVTESVTIKFVQNIAEKQVFLAWAGQRIILEHDWRLAPGDGAASSTGPVPNGTCPFNNGSTFWVQHIKGTGPGNFVAGLGVNIDGADEASVYVGASDVSQTLESANVQDDDINDFPQDNCISRVLYESEDPGEVDIEAFAYQSESETENYTKVAFVVYYMKINTINVSLVTQVSKPTHNSSFTDFAPGNPWDASKDDADNAVDWNVSKDLLVRGRVTGWFVNSNPSGRAADASNLLNVLPANRWVMPNDWPLLAGGPADPADGGDAGVPNGTAETFRPYYDIMIAPNNARGLALTTPDGASFDVVAVVAAGNVGTGSATNPIKVSSCADLPAGRTVKFGSVVASDKTVSVCSGTSLFLTSPFTTAPAAGTLIISASSVPFEGPYSLLDIVGLAAEGKGGAALSNEYPGSIRDTANDDGDVDMWDAPMPPAPVSVALRGTGFIKAVYKDSVYYNGTANSPSLGSGLGNQTYPNAFYLVNIPDSPFIPAVVAGGGYHWNSWGNDGPGGDGMGPYWFWEPVLVGTNSEGIGEITSTTSADGLELGLIRTYYGDSSIARDLVVYSDNHGEFMVAANGDFKTDLTACATNVLAGGKHCKTGDKVGTGTITATVDYPDFRGKHFPVLSNAATVTWTWGGYKDVTVEAGETDQYKYIVFHAMDRDGFCSNLGSTAVLLHSVLASSALGMDDYDTAFTAANLATSMRYNNDPVENVDFLIDSGEGIIIGVSDAYATINDGKQFATDVWTYSTYENDPAVTGIKEFPFSSLAAAGAVDECQAWIKVSNSLLGILNVLAIANDDEGNIGFDKIIDLTNTTSYTLNFRWSLVTWAGADAITVNDAIKGTGTTGKNPGGNDISASVTAIYGWDAAAQQWLGFFPSGVNVPGANDLTGLKTGQAYWIAITGPSSVTWTIASNVN